jgi:hypothetical protein
MNKKKDGAKMIEKSSLFYWALVVSPRDKKIRRVVCFLSCPNGRRKLSQFYDGKEWLDDEAGRLEACEDMFRKYCE